MLLIHNDLPLFFQTLVRYLMLMFLQFKVHITLEEKVSQILLSIHNISFHKIFQSTVRRPKIFATKYERKIIHDIAPLKIFKNSSEVTKI